MRLHHAFFVLYLMLVSAAYPAYAKVRHLDIAHETVTITGERVEKITVNGGIPGPILRFKEGDEAVITVTNHLTEDTSIHWHGILLPGNMDGVPGLNGFDGIQPGETFTYRFPLRQAGTYWYHAHSMGQEQDGVYGALIIDPKDKDPITADRDYVVLLSDYSLESSAQILSNLKMDASYYNYGKRTLPDFIGDAKRRGLRAAWQDAREWGQMRMSPTDMSDVTGYHFLMNGKTYEQNWAGLFTPGERVRLRFINASAMSIYDVRIPGLKLRVVQADGQPVEPVEVDEFRFGVAETYDVIVTPKDDVAYTIVAEPIDRSGFALGTLNSTEGARGTLPTPRKRSLLTMYDMHMESMMKIMPDMDMSGPSATISGWADADTPTGHKALRYEDLRFAGTQRDTHPPSKDIEVRLGGSMERYIWTLNGKKFQDATPIQLAYNERVRLRFVNETMMAHPIHLHGMFVQLENDQPANKLPNKHTIIVPPGQSTSVLLTADESGEWPIHCHLLYHMMSGMMNTVIVAERSGVSVTSPAKTEHHHHAH